MDELATVGNVNLDLATWKNLDLLQGSATCSHVTRHVVLRVTRFQYLFSTSLVLLAFFCYKVVLRATQRVAYHVT